MNSKQDYLLLVHLGIHNMNKLDIHNNGNYKS